MLGVLLLLVSAQAVGLDRYEKDVQCATAMMVASESKLNPTADDDTRIGIQLALQFYLGRLTASSEDQDWISIVTDAARATNVTDAFRLIVPCIGRKAQLLGQPGKPRGD